MHPSQLSAPTSPAAGFISQSRSSLIQENDARTIVMSFVAAGLVMLTASLLLDIALFAVVIEGARSLQAVASLRLATEMLPLCLIFTALVALLTGVAVIYIKSHLADVHACPGEPGLSMNSSHLHQLGFA